jgi:transposase
MGAPLSMDLRERVVKAVEQEGMSRHQAAARFGVAVSTAVNWLKRLKQTGSVAPGQMGGHKKPKISGAHRDWLLERCRRPFALRQLVAELGSERDLKVDYRSVWEFVHAEGLSYKKTVRASEQDRPDIARRRAQWRRWQQRIDPARLVFIDETWTKTNMAPLRGWAQRGARLLGKAPYGRWNTKTFIAALLRCDRIEAPWLLDGPINGESFRTYVEKVLARTLRPGDLVVMDKLGSHRNPSIRKAIRNAGAKMFLLPRYSPDLNPIEQVFAKLKHGLRKAAARTYEGLCDAIADVLETCTPKECANYFRNSGYVQT